MTDRLLSVDEVCEKTTLSRPTIYRYVAEGRLTGYRLGPRRLAFSETQINSFLEESLTKTDEQ